MIFKSRRGRQSEAVLLNRAGAADLGRSRRGTLPAFETLFMFMLKDEIAPFAFESSLTVRENI